MPQIQINQQSAKIGLKIKQPEMSLKQNKSTVEIKQETGKMKIKKDIVEVNVDNYPARKDLGYKNTEDMSKSFAQQGKQAVMNSIKRYASQGDQLMKVEKKGKPIITQAKQKTKQDQKEIGLRWKRGPRISVKPHKLSMKYKPNYPSIKAKMGSVESNLGWGTVKATIDQYNKLDISLTGNSLNRMV